MTYSNIENKGIQIAIEISSLLSFIGSGSVIISTFITKNFFGKGKLWNRFIFILSFWDLYGSFDILIRQLFFNTNDNNCKLHGLSIHFFYLCSIIWTAGIAFNIFFITVLNKKIKEIEHYEIFIYIALLGLSLLLTLPLYYLDKNNASNIPILGDTTFWCWITKDYSKYKILFFYCPLWIIFLFNTFVYVSTEIICKKRNYDYLNQSQTTFVKKNVVKRSDLYLLVLFVIWIWGSIDTIQSSLNLNYPIYVIQFLYSFFTPLQGFLNSLVYFWFSVFKHFSYLKKNECFTNNNSRILADGNDYFNSFYDKNNKKNRSKFVSKLEQPEKADYTLPLSPILRDVSFADEKFSSMKKSKKYNNTKTNNDYYFNTTLTLPTFTLEEDDTIYGKYFSNNNIFENSNSLSMSLDDKSRTLNNNSNTTFQLFKYN
ncbi:hypothetical protein BCR36DRAFT_366369 [Piromyces finnis]|uniref:G-protein coupled receptors family 2 profile 2 domain-containing protein n=1 Tax=Piromyces finnis TaxID=1754191 RepID=A0A1Y1VL82_9FUNG|nr:hypothetical protein BCR36DRAFT_366369 [Piromyces finnis]|eukprot:ORX59182.1 hypothetical protein BCR36DRAFT_366369 [Piromyces finnis]